MVATVVRMLAASGKVISVVEFSLPNIVSKRVLQFSTRPFVHGWRRKNCHFFRDVVRCECHLQTLESLSSRRFREGPRVFPRLPLHRRSIPQSSAEQIR